MVHRIVQFALASLLTTTLAAGTAWAQDEGGEEPAGEDPAGAEGGGEAEAGGEAGGEAGMEEGGDTGGGEMAAEAPKKIRFGVTVPVVIPISPEQHTEGVGFGVGVLGGVNYGLSDKLALAGNVGLIYHFAKNDITVMEIPIIAGVRFAVIPKLAIGADTGINIIRASIEFMGESESDSNTRIPLALHAGYMVTPNIVVGAGLWLPNFLLREDGEDMAIDLAAYAGYMF